MDRKPDNPTPPSSNPTPQPKWREDLKNPIVLISLALAVISIGITVYFYFKGKETRELSIHEVAITKVYDSTSTSRKLSVIDATSKPVTNDVYVASYQLWNSGTLPIEPADLRRPFKMFLNGDARILDWTIPYCVSDSDVCRFQLEPNDTNVSPNSVTLKWQHFDPNHGCQIQFMYAGASNSALGFESPFTGNGTIVDVNYVSSLKRYSVITSIVACIFILFVGCDVIRMLLVREMRLPKGFDRFNLVYVPMVLGIIAILIFKSTVNGKPKTPFPPNVPINFKSPEQKNNQP